MEKTQIIQFQNMPNTSGVRPNPWIGRSIGDRQRYRLDWCLGEGGMGYVFLATDTLLGKQVALKLLKETLVASSELRQRFENEIKVCATLQSDYIVSVWDYGETVESLPFYVMEYLRGQSLGQLLQQQRQLSIERTVNIVDRVCDGLSLAHKGVTFWWEDTVSEHVRVVHRDLKPDNIFLVSTMGEESVKILDFGIAKIYTNQERAQLTRINTFVGTYHYAAPEQVEGANVDERADIYSLGMIFYEMLSGEDPFGLGLNTNTINDMTWALAHLEKPVRPLRLLTGLSNLSPLLEAVVLKCLKKSPSDRFTSVDDLKIALQVAVKSYTVSPPIPIQHNSENKTILRPLTLQPQPVGNCTSKLPVESVDLGSSDTIELLEKNFLQEILVEIIGITAFTLVEYKAARASSTKDLVNKLLPYLSPLQKVEFTKKAMLLGTFAVQTPTRQIQVTDTNFLQQCEENLAKFVGPIAKSLIQETCKSHPQVSQIKLINILAKHISNSKQAKDFTRFFTG